MSDIENIRMEINPIKHRLIEIVRKIESISPKKAEKLDEIIFELEKYQRTLKYPN